MPQKRSHRDVNGDGKRTETHHDGFHTIRVSNGPRPQKDGDASKGWNRRAVLLGVEAETAGPLAKRRRRSSSSSSGASLQSDGRALVKDATNQTGLESCSLLPVTGVALNTRNDKVDGTVGYDDEELPHRQRKRQRLDFDSNPNNLPVLKTSNSITEKCSRIKQRSAVEASRHETTHPPVSSRTVRRPTPQSPVELASPSSASPCVAPLSPLPVCVSQSDSLSIQLPNVASPHLGDCLHQFCLWLSAASSAIQSGVCIDKNYSAHLIRSIRRLSIRQALLCDSTQKTHLTAAASSSSSSSSSSSIHLEGLCGTPDLSAIEKIVLSDVIPFAQRFFALVESFQLGSLFDVVQQTKRTSVGKEKMHCLMRGIVAVIDATAVLEAITTVMGLPGSMLLADCLCAEQFMEEALHLLKFGCLRVLMKAVDTYSTSIHPPHRGRGAPSSRGHAAKQTKTKKHSDASGKEQHMDVYVDVCERDEPLPDGWKSTLLLSVSAIIESLVRSLLNQQFPPFLASRLLSLVMDCLVVKNCSPSVVSSETSAFRSLHIISSDLIVKMASQLPSIRSSIDASLIQHLVPNSLLDLIPSTARSKRLKKTVTTSCSSHHSGRLLSSDGIALHPFTVTLLRLSHLFSLPDSSSAASFSPDLIGQLRLRVVESTYFIRRVCQQLIQICLTHCCSPTSIEQTSSTVATRKTNLHQLGVAVETKCRHRDVLRGIILDVCEAATSPLFPSSVAFLEQFCRALLNCSSHNEKHAASSGTGHAVWFEESSLLIFAEMARFLFSCQFSAQQSWITIRPFVKTLTSTAISLSSAPSSHPTKALVCARCCHQIYSVSTKETRDASLFTEETLKASHTIKCRDCHQCFHAQCTEWEEGQQESRRTDLQEGVTEQKEMGDPDWFCCESCLLRRASLHLFKAFSIAPSPQWKLLVQDVTRRLHAHSLQFNVESREQEKKKNKKNKTTKRPSPSTCFMDGSCQEEEEQGRRRKEKKRQCGGESTGGESDGDDEDGRRMNYRDDEERFLLHAHPQLVFACLLLDHTDRNGSMGRSHLSASSSLHGIPVTVKREFRSPTMSQQCGQSHHVGMTRSQHPSLNGDRVEPESDLSTDPVLEMRWLVPLRSALPLTPETSAFLTRSALLALFAKTFFPSEFRTTHHEVEQQKRSNTVVKSSRPNPLFHREVDHRAVGSLSSSASMESLQSTAASSVPKASSESEILFSSKPECDALRSISSDRHRARAQPASVVTAAQTEMHVELLVSRWFAPLLRWTEHRDVLSHGARNHGLDVCFSTPNCSSTAPLLHQHAVKRIWKQIVSYYTECTRWLIVLKILLLSKSGHAASRRAAVSALATCIVSNPSFISHEYQGQAFNNNSNNTAATEHQHHPPPSCFPPPSGAVALATWSNLLRDPAPRVREKAVGEVIVCWNRVVDELKDRALIQQLVNKMCRNSNNNGRTNISSSSNRNDSDGAESVTTLPSTCTLIRLPTDQEIVALCQSVVFPSSKNRLPIGTTNPHFYVSAFGTIGQAHFNQDFFSSTDSPAARVFIDLLKLLHFLVHTGLPQVAESMSSSFPAVRIRAVRSLDHLPTLPMDCPLLGVLGMKLLQRLEAADESPAVQFDAARILNALWFQLPDVKQLPSNAEPDSIEVSASDIDPSHSISHSSPCPCPTALDIFVKVVVSSSSASFSSASFESIVRQMSKQKTKLTVPHRKRSYSSTDGAVGADLLSNEGVSSQQSIGAWKKILSDYHLSPIAQIIAVPLLSQTWTLEDVDRCLSALTFRLFTLFLQRTSQAQMGVGSRMGSACYPVSHASLSAIHASDKSNDLTMMTLDVVSNDAAMTWRASALEITKSIRLLIDTRPVALSKSLIKHLYPCVNRVPKTAEDADLLSELLHIIAASISGKQHLVTASARREAHEFEASIVEKLAPTGPPSLVEAVIEALAASVTVVTRNFTLSIEPLFVDCLFVLLPFRECMKHLRLPIGRPSNQSNHSNLISPLEHSGEDTGGRGSIHDLSLELLRYSLSLLTKHRTVKLPIPCSSSARSSSVCSSKLHALPSVHSESSRSNSTSISVYVKMDATNLKQLKKQWSYVNETIRRRIWLLACLCRSVDLDEDLEYDLGGETQHDGEDQNVSSNETDRRHEAVSNGLGNSIKEKGDGCLLELTTAVGPTENDCNNSSHHNIIDRTPQPRQKGNPLMGGAPQSNSQEKRGEKQRENESQTPSGRDALDTQHQDVQNQKQKDTTRTLDDILRRVESASLRSNQTSIAMSRLIERLLPTMVEETRFINLAGPGIVDLDVDSSHVPPISTAEIQLIPLLPSVASDASSKSMVNQAPSPFDFIHRLHGDPDCWVEQSMLSVINQLTVNFSDAMFQLFLDLYQQFDLLVQHVTEIAVRASGASSHFYHWLIRSLIQQKSLLLQSFGLFLQKEKSYIRSTRVRSAFLQALKSWEFPNLQRSALYALSSLLRQFEVSSFAHKNQEFIEEEKSRAEKSNIRNSSTNETAAVAGTVSDGVKLREGLSSAQPLAFNNGQEFADITRGYVLIKNEVFNHNTTGTIMDAPKLVDGENRDPGENIRLSSSVSIDPPHHSHPVGSLTPFGSHPVGPFSLVAEFSNSQFTVRTIADSRERIILQNLALTILGQLVRQGLVNPIAISDTLFTLLFYSVDNLKYRALDVLKEGIEILSEDVLIINRLEVLLNQAFFASLFFQSPMTKKVPSTTLSSSFPSSLIHLSRCSMCSLPDPFLPSTHFHTYFSSFIRLYKDCLQSKRVSSERCLNFICAALQHQLVDRALLSFVAKMVEQDYRHAMAGQEGEGPMRENAVVVRDSCLCSGALLMDQLTSLSPVLHLQQRIEFLIALTFSRWIAELLVSLPYRLEVEVLFVNHSLATMLLHEVTPFIHTTEEVRAGSAAEQQQQASKSSPPSSSVGVTEVLPSNHQVNGNSIAFVCGQEVDATSSSSSRLTSCQNHSRESSHASIPSTPSCGCWRAFETVSACMAAVTIKQVLKAHYELTDEDCLKFNPSNALGQFTHVKILSSRQQKTEEDERNEDVCNHSLRDTVPEFPVEKWKESIIDLIAGTIKVNSPIATLRRKDETQGRAPEGKEGDGDKRGSSSSQTTRATQQIVAQLGKYLLPKLTGAFDIHPDRLDSVARSLLRSMGSRKGALGQQGQQDGKAKAKTRRTVAPQQQPPVKRQKRRQNSSTEETEDDESSSLIDDESSSTSSTSSSTSSSSSSSRQDESGKKKGRK